MRGKRFGPPEALGELECGLFSPAFGLPRRLIPLVSAVEST